MHSSPTSSSDRHRRLLLSEIILASTITTFMMERCAASPLRGQPVKNAARHVHQPSEQRGEVSLRVIAQGHRLPTTRGY